MKNSPIIVTGPSGSGKSSLIKYIEDKNTEFYEATGMTTRNKRENEIDRINFVTKKEFEEYIKNNLLIEYILYNGNYYGMPKSEFKKLEDKKVIFNVGYNSAKVIKSFYEKSKMIYLMPQNKEELIKRLGDRGLERYRLGIEETIKNALYYEYLLISYKENLEKIYNDFMEIVEEKESSKQKKLILKKNKDFIKHFYD